jgi:hypothetical protein
MPTEETSLTARLAASLPRPLPPDRTMRLVREAVGRARDKRLPLTAGTIAALVAAAVAESSADG